MVFGKEKPTVGLCESSCERGFELRREGTARGTGTAHTPSPNCALRYGVWLWIQVYAERGCSRSRAALRLMIPRPWQWHGHTTRARATVKAAAAPSSAFDLCGCTRSALLATRRRHGVQVREQLCRRALHARADGLGATDHLLCEGAVCTRVCDRVLRRCHAAPKRCGSELEL